jgi:hypothetical protein
MNAMILLILSTFALSTLVLGPAVMAAQPSKSVAPKTTEAKQDAQAACMNMMQGSGTTEEGTKAMNELMQSPKGAQAMNNMMEMARRMGNGDPMLGMSKMMEMMGGQGGMGGQGSPAPHRPK